MHLQPFLLQHHFEVKLSLAESLCSEVEETKAWEIQDLLKGWGQLIPRPVSMTSRTLCAQEQLYSASEEVRQAENKSSPCAVEIIKDGEKPSRIFLPLTFLDALHIQNISILHLNTLFFKSLPTNTKELYVLKYYSDMSLRPWMSLSFGIVFIHFTCLYWRKWLTDPQTMPRGTKCSKAVGRQDFIHSFCEHCSKACSPSCLLALIIQGSA